jgi:hypothetical protein
MLILLMVVSIYLLRRTQSADHRHGTH